jgi:hypothetical protein
MTIYKSDEIRSTLRKSGIAGRMIETLRHNSSLAKNPYFKTIEEDLCDFWVEVEDDEGEERVQICIEYDNMEKRRVQVGFDVYLDEIKNSKFGFGAGACKRPLESQQLEVIKNIIS